MFRMALMAVRADHGERLPRRNGIGWSWNPSARMVSARPLTRVATCTSKPASLAARAIGKRCDRNAQSSDTRYRIRLEKAVFDTIASVGSFAHQIIRQA